MGAAGTVSPILTVVLPTVLAGEHGRGQSPQPCSLPECGLSHHYWSNRLSPRNWTRSSANRFPAPTTCLSTHT